MKCRGASRALQADCTARACARLNQVVHAVLPRRFTADSSDASNRHDGNRSFDAMHSLHVDASLHGPRCRAMNASRSGCRFVVAIALGALPGCGVVSLVERNTRAIEETTGTMRSTAG